VKPGFDARLSGFDFAGDPFTDSSLRAKRDQRGFRALAVSSFKRSLQCPQFICVHFLAGAFAARTLSRFGAWRKGRYYFVGLIF
jgi:hypothetical protein